ncbi:hypothetical protein COX85_01060 [Candidatus Micrarchaeota archaeon CG_4_10_14_0_2_um_filter_55_9]|nr:MAG: hypothetical protein AUJ15_02030 [Candidatus Micrarchaeota archaeon CG1_02_55_41]PIZ91968.1 MAG: hypothetical protein COX85_01060 [Candidatus Micrarchaeota archaeon CG_4_10_14_0_2_um_filter_55_9]
MATLRSARTCRTPRGQPWTRTSRSKPRKSYVKGVPHCRIRQFNMGKNKRFEVELELVSQYDVLVRDNAIESARMASNKYLERHLEHNYFLQVAKYPHHVLREHAALGVAGSDRISKGMKGAFGKPKGRMALVEKGGTLFRVRCEESAVKVAKDALKRAKLKIPGKHDVTVRDIRDEAYNLSRPLDIAAIEDVKVEEEKPVEEEVVEGEAKAEGEEKVEEKEGEGKEEEPEAKGKPGEEKKEKKK